MKTSMVEQVEWIFLTNFEQDQISRREHALMLMIKALAAAHDSLSDQFNLHLTNGK